MKTLLLFVLTLAFVMLIREAHAAIPPVWLSGAQFAAREMCGAGEWLVISGSPRLVETGRHGWQYVVVVRRMKHGQVYQQPFYGELWDETLFIDLDHLYRKLFGGLTMGDKIEFLCSEDPLGYYEGGRERVLLI